MDLFFLLKGVVLGFVLAMSIGPIALLCISNTLEKGRPFGLAVAFGAATADGIYGTAAALGITYLMEVMSEYEIILKIIGSTFLLYLGVKILRSKPNTEKYTKLSSIALFKTYLTIVGLTLINPLTIATYMGAFAGLGVGNTGGELSLSLLLGLGVLLGSALWHVVLVTITTVLKERIKEKQLLWLNRSSGILLFGFGLLALGSLI